MNRELQEFQVQVEVELGLKTEAAALRSANDDFSKIKALAALSILLPQLVEPKVPEELVAEVPLLLKLLDAADQSVQAGACAVVTGVLANDEGLWRRLVVEQGIAAKLTGMLERRPESNGLQINLLSALLAAAQGGDEGTCAVADAGMQPVLDACSSQSLVKVQESAVDLICQVASNELCRDALAKAGAVPALCRLLAAQDREVQVRTLMGLGMLLPGSQESQRAVACDKSAVRNLLALMRQDEDADIKAISRDLFTGLAKNCKDEVTSAMRAETSA